MTDIPEYRNFKKIESINKGSSCDIKFYVETFNEEKLLLRIADAGEYKRKKTIVDLTGHEALRSIPMQKTVGFGFCDNGRSVYHLLTWCDGENAEEVLPFLSDPERYSLGVKSGEILRKIHAIPAPDLTNEWQEKYDYELQARKNLVFSTGIEVSGAAKVFGYYDNNKHLLKGRPQCFHHGDYHIGNFVISDKKDLSVIDWELMAYGNFADPWEEFGSLAVRKFFPFFAVGQLHGYFGGEPPEEFWNIFALYFSVGALMNVGWTNEKNRAELENSIKAVGDVLLWFDGMRSSVPAWYFKKSS